MSSARILFCLCRLVFIIAAVLLSSCSSPPQYPQPGGSSLPDGAWWTTAPAHGSPKIVISLDEQRVALFKGGQIVGLSPISSGREGYSTRPGSFRVTEKDIDHRSSLYGAYVDATGNVVLGDVDARSDPQPPGTRFVGADMHFFMRINGAIGMHRGYLPGYPASHGCIRLPGAMASLFFHATPHGTPVEIRQNAALSSLQPRQQPSLPVVQLTSPAVSAAPASRPVKAVKAPKTKRGKLKPGATLYWDGGP